MSFFKSIYSVIASQLGKHNFYITKSLSYSKSFSKLPPNLDFVRQTTLELCYNSICENQVEGNVAELGVYKGNFAQKLNALFSSKKLYLFDTFTGFAEEDIATEKSNAYSEGNQDFSDTSVQMVLKKMENPDNCIVKKGFFPDTAEGVEDTFCFVSIDTDLYKPIYEGLKFFYPRLSRGGFIFVHDVNNDGYKGAKDAVKQFCQENNTNYIPIPDIGGTAIITK